MNEFREIDKSLYQAPRMRYPNRFLSLISFILSQDRIGLVRGLLVLPDL